MFPRRFFQKSTRVSSAVAEPDVISPEVSAATTMATTTTTSPEGQDEDGREKEVAKGIGRDQIAIPVGRLSKEDLQPRLSVHQGIPATASILAFEPVQRVLAVASLDGRIKLFGLPGVEILLQSPTPAPCKFLKFMNNGEQLVQITTQNNIEIWNLEKQELACSLKWEHDITAIAMLQGTPYMYLFLNSHGSFLDASNLYHLGMLYDLP
jgi:WD40 repeat protein